MSAIPGRNDPCSCGSGKKYKKCCGSVVADAPMPAAPPESPELRHLLSLIDAGRFADGELEARRLLLAQPNSGLAWKALSVSLAMQDKPALAALERSAQLLPNDAQAQSNLGIALQDVGRLEESVACHRRAVALAPAFAEGHNNLATALRALGQLDSALASYRRAIELKPEFAMAYSNLGNLLRDMGQLSAAELGYRRAIELQPDSPEAHKNLGAVLRLQNRSTEAEASCRRALALHPRFAPALVSLAKLAADGGRFDEAEDLLKRAIEIEPESAEAWSGLASLRRMTSGDTAWLASVESLVTRVPSARHELVLRYALGKYFDDVGDPGRAFENYRRANDLSKRLRLPYRPEEVEKGFSLIQQSQHESWVNRSRKDANQSETPVFIVGMPRSGTSLAEQILAAHPSVYGAGELAFWSTAAGRHPDVARDPSSEATLRTLAKEFEHVLGQLSGGATRVVDKMPGNFAHVGLIRAAFPRARFIHMLRNPIDTCLSIYFQDFEAAHPYATDLANLAHYYSQYTALMAHWRRVLPPEVLLEVPYESLVDDPETWSRRMVQFIGLPWDDRCLEFHRVERNVSTASNWQVRQKITRTSVERWRKYESFVGPLRELAS